MGEGAKIQDSKEKGYDAFFRLADHTPSYIFARVNSLQFQAL
jgi:hypothetical protein